MSWQDFADAAQQVVSRPMDWVRNLQSIPHRASDIADAAYPDSARDSSRRNAYRHSLGTGMMTQHLGGNALSAGLAKMAGWGWEAPTLLNPNSTPAQLTDTRHDLNANAIGSQVAQMTRDQPSLEAALRSFADQAVVRTPPGAFERGSGYLTRSVR